ncbi:ATP-dependent DNA ligase [Rossellomorea sp. LjRoot5]|uniref:ATP-dependent DNA ligase n=1 Tax=Rossellomorea sp. LjRoot5 TaxID=3342331 RepID=UPI003ECF0943
MFISPMLLHKADEPFDSKDYITELKLDGIRLIYTKDLFGKVRLYTRHNNEVTNRFPELVAGAKDLQPGTILDGELIVTDSEGKPDFERTMARFMSGKDQTPVSFVAFDLLQSAGSGTTHLPLLNRKELLEGIITNNTGAVSKVQFIEGNGPAYYDAVCQQALEGIVLKRKGSLYEVGKRSHSWLKVINYQIVDVLVTGFRKSEFGWLLADEAGKPQGIMELGVPVKERAKVYGNKIKEEREDLVYIEPIKCRVKYRNITSGGLLRLPSFVSWL